MTATPNLFQDPLATDAPAPTAHTPAPTPHLPAFIDPGAVKTPHPATADPRARTKAQLAAELSAMFSGDAPRKTS